MTVATGADAFDKAGAVLSSEDMYRMGLEASTGGETGEFDLITAHKWFNLAAMLGSAEARAYRAELANEMTAEEIAEAQRQARAYIAGQRASQAA
ncbi:MAG: sel1 repeat family protein [Pseudomonadota bacterium]